MKTGKKILIALLVLLFSGINSMDANSLKKEVKRNINSIGIWQGGGPPPWAPAHGKRAKVRYYYIPEIEVYYDLVLGEFVWWNGFTWSFSMTLPAPYATFNLYTSHRVVLDYYGNYPWYNHTFYRVKYPSHKVKYSNSKVVNKNYYGKHKSSPGNNVEHHKGKVEHKDKGKGKVKGHSKRK